MYGTTDLWIFSPQTPIFRNNSDTKLTDIQQLRVLERYLSAFSKQISFAPPAAPSAPTRSTMNIPTPSSRLNHPAPLPTPTVAAPVPPSTNSTFRPVAEKTDHTHPAPTKAPMTVDLTTRAPPTRKQAPDPPISLSDLMYQAARAFHKYDPSNRRIAAGVHTVLSWFGQEPEREIITKSEARFFSSAQSDGDGNGTKREWWLVDQEIQNADGLENTGDDAALLRELSLYYPLGKRTANSTAACGEEELSLESFEEGSFSSYPEAEI